VCRTAATFAQGKVSYLLTKAHHMMSYSLMGGGDLKRHVRDTVELARAAAMSGRDRLRPSE
jgi:hypothetical protein